MTTPKTPSPPHRLEGATKLAADLLDIMFPTSKWELEGDGSLSVASDRFKANIKNIFEERSLDEEKTLSGLVYTHSVKKNGRWIIVDRQTFLTEDIDALSDTVSDIVKSVLI